MIDRDLDRALRDPDPPLFRGARHRSGAEHLRDSTGFLSAADEVAWLSGERRQGAVSSQQQVEGAVADSDGPGQGGNTEEPHTDEW